MDVKNGTLVRLNQPCLRNPKGALGVCIDRYLLDNRPGYQFIFENGETDGFSNDDCNLFLEKIGETMEMYNFKNVIKLDTDYRNGYFNSAFELGHSHLERGTV